MPRYGDVQVSFGPPLRPIIKYLLIINTVTFILSHIIAGKGWVDVFGLFGLSPYRVTHRFWIWQFVTYLFLHANGWHLVLNMYVLWFFGSDLEQYWGRRRFLTYYFLTGIGAGLFDVMVHPSANTPTVGCSGALYGLLLAYAIYFGERTLLLAFILPIKAKWLVAIMGVVTFWSALTSQESSISHIAHLGGLIAGFLYLRGGGLPYRWRLRYHEWRRARLRKKFEAFMRKHEDKDDSGRWVN